MVALSNLYPHSLMNFFSNNIIYVVFSLLAVSIVIVHYYYQSQFSEVRKCLNLSGPFAWPILGNWNHIYLNTMDKLLYKWQEKYGSVFTFFMGSTASIMISDCELIRQICIKDFDFFPNHTSNFFTSADEHYNNFIFFKNDLEWKRQRALLSPTFTISKVKTLYKLIDESGNELVNSIHEQIDELESYQCKPKSIRVRCAPTNNDGRSCKKVTLPLYSTYELYTLNSIINSLYGLKICRQKGEHTIEAIAKRSQFVCQLFKLLFETDYIHTFLSQILPQFLHPLLYQKSTIKNFAFVERSFRAIIEERKRKQNNPSKCYNDYFQILVDAKLDENEHSLLTEQQNNLNSTSTKDSSETKQDTNLTASQIKKTLTDEEMIANAIFMISERPDSTAVSILVTTYSIAMHQQCQEKLYGELNKIAIRDEQNGTYEFDYEQLTGCEYLDAVICESLRIHSPVSMTERQAISDYKIEKYNVNVSQGMSVFFLMQLVHRNPKYWHQPLEFDPERFMPQNRNNIVPGSYIPFGQGPRHCVVMRFALTEIKLAIAKVVMHFRFSPKHDNVWPLQTTTSQTLGLANFINCDVLVEKR